jgi:hypothetical protein
MNRVMSVERAERAAVGAGVATLFIGAGLALAPGRVGPVLGLVEPTGARAVGVADLALVPGLIAGRPRWPWMAARAGLNIAIVAYAHKLHRQGAPRAGAAARALLGITVVDTAAVVTLVGGRG